MPEAASRLAGTDPVLARHALNFDWLLRLRWAAAAGQALTLGVASELLHLALPLGPLAAVIALGLASNALAWTWRRVHEHPSPGHLAILLLLDVLALTALLYFTGGPSNPFSFLYLVTITLAAVVLPWRYSVPITVASVASLGFLFLRHRPLHLHLGHASPMDAHVLGMWVALGVAGVFTVYFIGRLRLLIGDLDAKLSGTTERAARAERLAALTTLAAGAAHELATPLGTIAVAAGELKRKLATGGSLDDERGAVEEDMSLIQAELGRCRKVIDRLSLDSAGVPGEGPETLRVDTLLAQLAEDLGHPAALELELPEEVAALELRLPVRSLLQALSALTENALQATPPGALVHLEASTHEEHLQLRIRDEGPGLSEAAREHLGEPFFTTRPEGHGLGVFLAYQVLEQLQGELHFDRAPGGGTVVQLRLPLS